ncbi:MAG: hypothetical protein RLZZ455_58 [Candidatus Parcubacteria bacterium]|jgi:undecaprenyl diphosphate synthase
MNIPTHIAFIMDGNRRWAVSHKLEMLFGHDKGAHQIEPLVEYASKKGVKFVTFWAFSTENWQRSEQEVAVLMEVFRRMFRDPMVERMKKNDVKFGVIGDISKFPQDIQSDLKKLLEETKDNKKITVTIALNYGGRDEILQAIKKAVDDKQFAINDKQFSNYLYTSNIPDPDFMIRTGGEKRLSGFLPWQSVYTELYFTDTLWPDFDEKELQIALDDFAARERRFGK